MDEANFDIGMKDIIPDFTPEDLDLELENKNLVIDEVSAPEIEQSDVSSRFAEIDEEHLAKFISEQKNPSTHRKTKQHVALFIKFLETKEEKRLPYGIPPRELDNYLAMFFLSVRKETSVDGCREYEPCTLKGMQSSIERYLKENNYEEEITKSCKFFTSREALASKYKSLKSMGKGNRPCRKRAPTENELNEMWDKRALGCNSPRTLQHTVWWIMCTRFGKRANKENYDMRWGDVEVRENEDGRQYLINKERSTKTRQGDNISDIKNEIKVFEDKEKPEYCPVQIFNKYENRRPADMCLPESNFYLQPKAYSSPETMEKDPTWYKKQVLQKICFKFTIFRKMIIFIVHVIPFSNICTRMMLPFLFFINKVTILLSQSMLSQLILSAILNNLLV